LIAALLVVAGCSSKGSGGAGPDKKGPPKDIAFPVQVTPVAAREVEYVVTAVGSVDAFEEVSITSRVTGVVETVRFKEGDRVEKGAVLVEIEPRRFQLAVAQAQAQMDRAVATRADAEGFLSRREKMSGEGVVSADELQTAKTRVATARADEAAAKAALGMAQVNLRDAYVRAPVGGTMQTRSVRTGMFAQPGAMLASILQVEPMLLRFDVPEADSHRVRPDMITRFTVQGVSAKLEAKITHVAASANPTSRMVPVVAEIVAAPADLRPGSFAEVLVPVGAKGDAPVIPETAIRPSDKGFLSFVVEDGKARQRVLTLGMRTVDGLVEVRSGLKPGESLVVRGAEALSEGASVRIDTRSAGPDGSGAAAAASATVGAASPATSSGAAAGTGQAAPAPAGSGAAASPGVPVARADAQRELAVNITEICIKKPVFAWMLMAGRSCSAWSRRRASASASFPTSTSRPSTSAVTREGAAPEVMENDVVEVARRGARAGRRRQVGLTRRRAQGERRRSRSSWI
jgi:multidrug efflux system membrane fusion protein